jgi:hypothetical protein
VALARARCAACTLPLGDAPHAQLNAWCARCGAPSQVAVAADGQAVDFDAGFNAAKLGLWFGAARVAMARGQPGVAIGACTRCMGPMVISSREPLALPCPHCQEPVKGTAGEVLVDLWPEPWTKVAAADLDLEYRLELVEDTAGGTALAGASQDTGAPQTAGCAACGYPTPHEDPSMVCRRCGACAWVARPAIAADEGSPQAARRVQLGVRVNGTRGNLPFKALVPVAQGEVMLRSDAARSGASESGRSLLSMTGFSCAALIAAFAIIIVIIIAAVHSC